MHSRIPPEIWKDIVQYAVEWPCECRYRENHEIDCVFPRYDDNQDAKATRRALSLTSRAFYDLCAAHLFEYVILNDEHENKCRKLAEILTAHSKFRVRSLEIHVTTPFVGHAGEPQTSNVLHNALPIVRSNSSRIRYFSVFYKSHSEYGNWSREQLRLLEEMVGLLPSEVLYLSWPVPARSPAFNELLSTTSSLRVLDITSLCNTSGRDSLPKSLTFSVLDCLRLHLPGIDNLDLLIRLDWKMPALRRFYLGSIGSNEEEDSLTSTSDFNPLHVQNVRFVSLEMVSHLQRDTSSRVLRALPDLEGICYSYMPFPAQYAEGGVIIDPMVVLWEGAAHAELQSIEIDIGDFIDLALCDLPEDEGYLSADWDDDEEWDDFIVHCLCIAQAKQRGALPKLNRIVVWDATSRACHRRVAEEWAQDPTIQELHELGITLIWTLNLEEVDARGRRFTVSENIVEMIAT